MNLIFSFLVISLSCAFCDVEREVAILRKEYQTCIVGKIIGPDERGNFSISETEVIWAGKRPLDEQVWLVLGTSKLFKPGSKVVCFMDYDVRGKRHVCFLGPDGNFQIGTKLILSIKRLRKEKKPPEGRIGVRQNGEKGVSSIRSFQGIFLAL